MQGTVHQQIELSDWVIFNILSLQHRFNNSSSLVVPDQYCYHYPTNAIYVSDNSKSLRPGWENPQAKSGKIRSRETLIFGYPTLKLTPVRTSICNQNQRDDISWDHAILISSQNTPFSLFDYIGAKDNNGWNGSR